MSKETVGKVARDLMLKEQDNTHSATDQMREQLEHYEENIYEAIERGKKQHEGDFFVVVLTKKERLMHNVLRNYFFTRISCPTPEWDQVVYRFDRAGEFLEFLWTIPARDICEYLKDNALNVSDDDRELLEFVMAYDDGTLLALSKQMNGEIIQPPTHA